MSRACPQNISKSLTSSEKTSFKLCFNACAWIVEVWNVQKCTKKWKIQDCLEDSSCTGGYMHEGSIKLVFKCPDRTCCPHDLKTFCHVQDMSWTFQTKMFIREKYWQQFYFTRSLEFTNKTKSCNECWCIHWTVKISNWI